MPYIAKGRRISLDRGLRSPGNVGELTYVIARECLHYLKRKGLSYQALSDVRAALFNVASEVYRRIGAPYEDAKIAENGDMPEFGWFK